MRGRLVIGAALVIIGVVWIGQGIGLIGGSFMTGEAVWAVIGAIALLFGSCSFAEPGGDGHRTISRAWRPVRLGSRPTQPSAPIPAGAVTRSSS